MGASRVIIVGASSGLGRCLGVGLVARGSQVALLARREENVVAAAAEAGNGAHPIRCDVTDPVSCASAIEQAAEVLGGIDAVVYSAGVGPLRRIEDLDPTTWHEVFDTNVVGAWQVTAAALPHLRASGGMIAYLTSVSASLTGPWPGLAAYTVTKAALDKLVEAWRSEHPDVGFTRLIVGECGGGDGDGMSQFTAGWDPDLIGEMFPIWEARGLITDKLMDVDDFIDAVDGLLTCGATTSIPSMAIAPRRPL